VAGVGNINTAEFWEYDSRLGRRWNCDPIFSSGISSFAVLRNCPMKFIDPYGNEPVKSNDTDKKTENKDIKLKWWAWIAKQVMTESSFQCFAKNRDIYRNSNFQFKHSPFSIYERREYKEICQNIDLSRDNNSEVNQSIETRPGSKIKVSFNDSDVTDVLTISDCFGNELFISPNTPDAGNGTPDNSPEFKKVIFIESSCLNISVKPNTNGSTEKSKYDLTVQYCKTVFQITRKYCFLGLCYKISKTEWSFTPNQIPIPNPTPYRKIR
jgi:hypothetical protein